MPVWDHEKLKWGSIRDRYSGDKAELKKVIKALMETPYEELDDWDDRPLREWMRQHTRDQGVIDLWEFLSVLECMTDDWYDHSASDNLYVRKMHYSETRMAGLLVLAQAGLGRHVPGPARRGRSSTAARCCCGTPVDTVVIENERGQGRRCSGATRCCPTSSSRARCSRPTA